MRLSTVLAWNLQYVTDENRETGGIVDGRETNGQTDGNEILEGNAEDTLF